MKQSNKNQLIFPIIAAVLVVVAVVLVLTVPKGGNKEAKSSANSEQVVQKSSEDEFLEIRADELSEETVSFIRLGGGSRIELIARKGADGKAKAALGTCQSCSGSPGAYYTQDGENLMCNNCGLTFPLTVIDEPGAGCHPISIDEELIEQTENGLRIDLKGLSAYEDLFSKVEDH